MTFKETEFPSLIRFLKSLLQEDPNPYLLHDVVKQLVALYEKAPLYPGIAEMCLAQSLKRVSADELQPGQKIYLRHGAKFLSGAVKNKNSSEVKIETEIDGEISIPLHELKEIRTLNHKIFEELWPSLVFEQKESEC